MLLGLGRKALVSFNCDDLKRRTCKPRGLIDEQYVGNDRAAALARDSSACKLAFP